jgi:hypothetical protein
MVQFYALTEFVSLHAKAVCARHMYEIDSAAVRMQPCTQTEFVSHIFAETVLNTK